MVQRAAAAVVNSRLRWVPFVTCAALSIWISSWAPRGRKPFHLILDVSPAAIAHVAFKPDHIAVTAGLCLFAVVAFGKRRLPLAVISTLSVSFCWELMEATVKGRLGRVADLTPNLIGITLGVLAVCAGDRLFSYRRTDEVAAA
jgi:hypothetical protein